MSTAPLVPIFMGSKSDLKHCTTIADELTKYGVDCEMRICSAHKAPRRLIELIDRYESDPRPKVYITCAGRSNALSGMADANIMAPIIACPPYSSTFGGNDIFSSLRMPGGVAPMVVCEPKNAAMAAVKIFGLSDDKLRARVVAEQHKNSRKLHVDDSDVKSHAYVNKIQASLESVFDKTELKLTPRNGVKEVTKYVGKVRDRYNDGAHVVLVTTDRLTGFDRPLAKIPFKGAVLNMISKWWFDKTEHIIENHVLSVPHPNVTIGQACTPFPIEFVMRGYITGSSATSMLTHYKNGVRDYCGIKLPDGLKDNQQLSENMITPTTKSDEHDELITPEIIVKDKWMTQEDWDYCAAKSHELFAFGQAEAAKRGMLLVDTKMEFGKTKDGKIVLIDEIFTPDSSRYWVANTYEANMAAGKKPENIDKEFVRLWFKDNCDPYKDEVLPPAPEDLKVELARRYVMLYELLTGEDFEFVDSNLPLNEAIQKSLDLLSA